MIWHSQVDRKKFIDLLEIHLSFSVSFLWGKLQWKLLKETVERIRFIEVYVSYRCAAHRGNAVMTQWSVKDKGLYYRPNTDHFFPKYRPNTDQFFQYFPKIQTIIIFVSILWSKLKHCQEKVTISMFDMFITGMENENDMFFVFTVADPGLTLNNILTLIKV